MSRHDINLKFLDKESLLFQSIIQHCSTRNLADVKIIAKYGKEIFLHRIVLIFAFPNLSEILPGDDSVTIIINDVVGEDLINARNSLYQNGDPEPLGYILEMFEPGLDLVNFELPEEPLDPEREPLHHVKEEHVDLEMVPKNGLHINEERLPRKGERVEKDSTDLEGKIML